MGITATVSLVNELFFSDFSPSEIIVPKDAPESAHALVTFHKTDSTQAANQLWNKANTAEKRVDAQLARQLEFALPLELSQADLFS